MPVASQIGLLVGHHHEVKRPRRDTQVTSGTQVLLGGRIRLDRGDRHTEKIAHASKPIATIKPTTIRTISRTSWSESRNGLKPMVER